MDSATKIPSKEELESLMQNCHMEQIARLCGVTSNAVRKWAKKYGITEKAKRYSGFTRRRESIEKGKKSLHEYYQTHKSHVCKKIVQMTLDGNIVSVFESIRSVTSKGFNSRMVAKAIQRKLKTYKGFLWKACSIEDENTTLSKCRRGDGIIRVYVCRYCGLLFTSRRDIRIHKKENHHSSHEHSIYPCKICGCKIKGKRPYREHMKIHYQQEGYSCKFCGKKFSKCFQIAAHTARCKGNPNYAKTIAAQTLMTKNRLKNGMPQSTRDKISLKMKSYFAAHPEAASYRYNHSSNGSWAEEYFDNLFKKEKVHSYVRQYHVLRYNLDFAFIEDMVDFEVDGHQHIADKRIVAHDKERTENLSTLGWKTIRLNWGYYQTLPQDGKREWLQSNLYPYIPHALNQLEQC